MLQHGAYRLLLDHYYASAKPLPANAELLHRVCRAFANAEREAIDFVLVEFFKKTARGYIQDRVEDELKKAENLSETRRNAANSRHAKAPAKVPTNAEQKHTQSQSHTQKEETPSLRSGDAPKQKRKSRAQIPEGFPFQADLDWAQSLWLGKGRADLCTLMDEEVAKFRDHHSNKLTAGADWPACWRTWARNTIKFSDGAHNGRSKSNGSRATSTDQHLAGIASLIGDIRAAAKPSGD
jgi:uncharacterized protein YdaU (DUF1376 family)